MAKTLRMIDKTALRQKGWWLFAAIIALQLLFVGMSYLLKAA